MCAMAYAQCNKIINGNVASLQVVAGSNWLSLPIISLYDNVPIHISFDELSHDCKRYAYRIEHCEADWSVSKEIFDSDFCDGFADGNIIEDMQSSVNTNTAYTHYKLTIPNEKCKLKISGNYRVAIYDENEGDTILYATFMVVDPKVSVGMTAGTNTDIDVNKKHQQIGMTVGYSGLNVSNPTNEIMVTVLQNGYWPDARTNVSPQTIRPDVLEWTHNRQLIFEGGNEYHKFETLDTSHPTLGVENTYWDGNEYHAELWTSYPRSNYVYDEDANGAFYIRNSDNYENDVASEYTNVRFRLKIPKIQNRIYIDGVWTNGEICSRYEMIYDNETKLYEKTIRLKQGYYSYRYITWDNAKETVMPLSYDGNFYQTENNYQALVYYRPSGQRTDLLIGYQNIAIKK